MMLARISPGFEKRSFECPKFDQPLNQGGAAGPLRLGAVGRLNSELKPPE
jgi:hypothetical protein